MSKKLIEAYGLAITAGVNAVKEKFDLPDEVYKVFSDAFTETLNNKTHEKQD